MGRKTGLTTPEPEDRKPGRNRAKRNVNGEGTIYQRKDGRYEGKVFAQAADGTYKRVSVYGQNWDECHSLVVKLQDQVRRGIPVATTTMTVKAYLEYWLHDVAEPTIRRTTFSTYEGAIRLHIIPGLGKRKLKALQAPHIRSWLSTLRKTCQCCAQGKDAKRAAGRNVKPRCCAKNTPECCGDFLSTSSIRHLLRVLRAALQDAVDEDLISRNVAKLVQLRVTDEHRVRALTAQDAQRLLAAAKQHRLYALWAVALAMGLRRGEALGLAWSEVDLVAGRLTIRQALHRVDGQLKLEAVKTDASNATLPLPSDLVAVLKRHRKRQLEERFEAGSEWQDTGLVFTTAVGGFIEPRNVNRMFSSLCDKAQIGRVRVHDLRHSCATLLFSMGVDAATVRRILRHSSITVTTGTYVEVIENVQRNALDSMGVFFAADSDDEESIG